jgi:hypothetical protein
MDKFNPNSRSEQAAKVSWPVTAPLLGVLPASDNLPFSNHSAELRYAAFGEQWRAQKHHA